MVVVIFSFSVSVVAIAVDILLVSVDVLVVLSQLVGMLIDSFMVWLSELCCTLTLVKQNNGTRGN